MTEIESALLANTQAGEELWAVGGEDLCLAAAILFAAGLSETGDRMLEQAVGVLDLLTLVHPRDRVRPQYLSAKPRA